MESVHTLSVGLLLWMTIFGFFLNSRVSANSAISSSDKNQISSQYKFASSNSTNNSTHSLKTLLNLLSKDRAAGFSLFQQLNSSLQMNPALANNSLAHLLHLGNGTFNASLIAEALNRTGRGYGGGGGGYGGQCCGGGFDPALWLLLRDDHGWGYPQQQQQQSSSMDNLGQLGLLTLLGLALISRMPTQG